MNIITGDHVRVPISDMTPIFSSSDEPKFKSVEAFDTPYLGFKILYVVIFNTLEAQVVREVSKLTITYISSCKHRNKEHSRISFRTHHCVFSWYNNSTFFIASLFGHMKYGILHHATNDPP